MSWWQQSTPVGDSSNLTKFLDFLSQAEGADYNTIVGGSKFNSFDAHPGIVGLRTKEGPSTAAGRYQITKTTYNDVAPRLGITDFSPQSQDAIAIELIRRGGAYDDVVKGNFEAAINKLGSTWASLPSSPYSQPKKSWEQVNRMLGVQVASNNASENWWAGATPVSDAPSNNNWWAGSTPVEAPAAAVGQSGSPQPAPARSPAPAPAQAAKAPAPAPAKKEEPRGVLRRVDDFVRGLADTVTFGYADEIAAKLDSLVGGGQSGLKSYDAALAAQRQRDKEGGVERTVGQVAGALAPTVGVVRAVDGATRLARAGAGAATGAIQGGLYGTGSAEGDIKDRLEQGAKGAGIGAVAGGALGAVIPATITQKGNALIRSAGGEDAARLDAEIIRDIQKLAKNETQRGNPITAVQLNAVENKYINDVQQALGKLSKTQDVGELRAALQNRRALTPEELAPLRQTKAGEAVADAIEKAQRARSLTQPVQSSGGVMPLVREVNRWILPDRVSTPLNAVLGGRQTREIAAQKALKQAPAAENVLERLGPSRATGSMQELADLAQQAQAARQAQVAAGRATRAARASKEVDPNAAISELQAKDPTYLLGLSNRFGPPRNADQMSEFSNVIRSQMEARAARQAAGVEKSRLISDIQKGPQVDPRIQVLQDTRVPLSGAFRELLPGGRSNLNLTSDEAIDALRLVSRQFKDRPVGQAAKDILRSGNVGDEAAFYGLQNQLTKLREQGVLGGRPGALSEATAASPIRNPISYAEAVRTAGAAADLARANAPSKELAQFATRVAGIKSPDAKAKAIADRLAKTTDPTEQAFLTQFVEPLAQFGKK